MVNSKRVPRLGNRSTVSKTLFKSPSISSEKKSERIKKQARSKDSRAAHTRERGKALNHSPGATITGNKTKTKSPMPSPVTSRRDNDERVNTHSKADCLTEASIVDNNNIKAVNDENKLLTSVRDEAPRPFTPDTALEDLMHDETSFVTPQRHITYSPTKIPYYLANYRIAMTSVLDSPIDVTYFNQEDYSTIITLSCCSGGLQYHNNAELLFRWVTAP